MAKKYNDAGKVSIVFKGAYDPTAVYEILDVVSANGGSYISVKNDNVGNALTNATAWLMLAKGIKEIRESHEGLLHTYTIEYTDGSTFVSVISDGYTPVKGSDYFTPEDISDLNIPRNTSDITNNSGFIDKTVNNLDNYLLKTDTGASLGLALDTSNYKMTLQLKNSNGTVIDTHTVDFPIESMVIDASYSNGIITLSLQNGKTIDVDVSSLISGLVPQTRLIAGIDLIDNISKSEMQTALNIQDGAQVNVIESITIDGTPVAVNNKTATIDLSGKEDKSNKVIAITSASTDLQYPSAKAVYDLVGDVETLLTLANAELEAI